MSFFSGILVSLSCAVCLCACSAPDIFIEETRYYEQQVKGHPDLKFVPIQEKDFQLNAISTGEVGRPVVVFIHGTPGDWRSASRYLMDVQLQGKAKLVAIDRPGWGDSKMIGGRVDSSFSEQARLIQPLLQQLKQDNKATGVILVGHSLGASLAPKIALNYPELVDGLILIAGSLDPKLGKPRWYNRVASIGLVSWFLNSDLRKANQEILPLQRELEEMLPRWREINIPVTVIQGMRDELVYPANVDFAEKVLINANLHLVRLEEAGHFIPWENREPVHAAIMDMLDKIEEAKSENSTTQ